MAAIERVAVITGVSSGIGRAIAELFVSSGYRVYGTVRSEGSTPPSGVEALRLDVRDQASVDAAIRRVLAESGRIDVLVNNAGATIVGAIEETDTAQAQALFDVNFFGAARVTRAVLPTMRVQGSGRIVFISSVVGFLPAPFMGFYAASKHALEGYAESLDHEVRGFGVRALLVEPSFIRTSIDQNSGIAEHPLDAYAEVRERVTAHINASVQAGGDPKVVAAKVFEAVTASSPRLRYPVGKGAGMLSRLRSFMPAGMLEGALRKDFRLDA